MEFWVVSVVMFEGGLCLRVSYMCDVVQQILRTCWDNDLRNVTLIIATRNNISTINIPKICFSVAAGGRTFLVLWERSTRYSGILRVGRAKALGGLYPHGRRRRPKKSSMGGNCGHPVRASQGLRRDLPTMILSGV